MRQVSQDRSLSYEHTIDQASVDAAVALIRWFGGEARRIYSLLGASPRERERHRRVELIRALGGSVSARAWQRKRGLATAGEAREQLAELVEAGVGEMVWPRAGPGQPSQRFVLAEPGGD